MLKLLPVKLVVIAHLIVAELKFMVFPTHLTAYVTNNRLSTNDYSIQVHVGSVILVIVSGRAH